MEIDWDSVSTEQDIIDVATAVFDELGISAGAFTYTPIARLPSGGLGLLRNALSIRLDKKLVENWLEYQDDIVGPAHSRFSQSFDPIRRYMSQQVMPRRLVMTEILKDKDVVRNAAASQWVKGLIKNLKLRESFHIPIFTGRGEYWAISALRLEDNPNNDPLSDDQMRYLYWIGLHFVDICVNKLGWREEHAMSLRTPLSGRELDCLYWAAHGCSSVETAEILEIQPDTARQYIKQAMKKLDARTQAQAVWKAYRRGYLNPA